MRRLTMALALPFLLAACGGGDTEEQAGTAADTVAMALAAYDPALFDTISWSADSAQNNRGVVVWNFSCKKCHGQLGHGDGEDLAKLAELGDTVAPPNFATSWRFGSDKEAVIKAIFAGSAEGMPHWGVSGMKPRDIDAVAAYTLQHVVGISDMTVQTSKD